ncbi:class I SAM-dependent methyltransferase [Patescibacteria group bacterium]
MSEKQDFYSENRATDIMETGSSYQYLLSLLKAWRVKKFLDIGCGDGSFTKAVRETCHCKVEGVEISSKSVQEAKDRGISAQVVDLDETDLPFPDESFDCVFCGYIIEHLYSPDHMLEEVHRVLKSGGKIIVSTANLASWFNRLSLLLGYQPIFSDVSLKHSFGHLWKMEPMGHLRLHTYDALRKLIRVYGFKIVAVKGLGISDRFGFGKAHPYLIKCLNFVFQKPSLCSHIIISGTK